MSRDVASQVIARQLARSGTSVGANVEEAQGSHSKAEFVRRMNIAHSEALETRYGLKLIVEGDLLPKRRLEPLVQEPTRSFVSWWPLSRSLAEAHDRPVWT
jgi:four helix bundle protein